MFREVGYFKEIESFACFPSQGSEPRASYVRCHTEFAQGGIKLQSSCISLLSNQNCMPVPLCPANYHSRFSEYTWALFLREVLGLEKTEYTLQDSRRYFSHFSYTAETLLGCGVCVQTMSQ